MKNRVRIAALSKQRGALTVTTPLIVLLIFFLTVLMLDGARLYAVKREMQAQVNAAAVAAAYGAHACGGPNAESNRNLSVEAGLLAAQAQGWRPGTGELVVEHGSVDFESAEEPRFRVDQDFLRSNAVGVRYSRSVPVSLLLPQGVFGLNNIEMSATAVARRELVATLSGAGATAVVGGDPQQATLLNVLLGVLLNDGNPFSFSATDLTELSDVTVRLGDLLDGTGVGSVVNSLPVNAQELAEDLSALVNAATPVGRLLDSLLKNTAVLEGIAVEDVLKVVESNTTLPENARIPVYDLVISMAMNVLQATLSEPVNVDVNLGGLAEVSLQLYIFQPPTVVIGPARLKNNGEIDDIESWETHFESADIAIALRVKLLEGLAVLEIDLPIVIRTGEGEGALVAATCARGGGSLAELYILWETEAATIKTATINESGGILDEDLVVTALALPVALNLSIALTTSHPDSNPVRIEAELWDQAPAAREVVGGDLNNIRLRIDRGKIECGGILGCIIDGLVGTVTKLLDVTILPLLNNQLMPMLADRIIQPLLESLGVGLGTMQITAAGVAQDVHLLQGMTFEVAD